MKIISTILLPLVISILLSACDKEDEEIQAIYNNPGYAIGTVAYSIETTIKTTYYFEYYVNGILYTGGKDMKNTEGAEVYYDGSTYLVVYDLSDPSRSHLNTDYVIESDQHFDDLINEFIQFPPEP